MNRKILIAIGILIIGIILLIGYMRQQKPTTLKPTTPTIPQKTGNLSQVKVAVIYQHIIDNIPPDRSLDDISKIFKETNTDFVIRALFKWYALPEEAYEKFGDTVEKIKTENSKILICGSFGAQFVDKKGEYDPIKKENLGPKEIKEMELDFSEHQEWRLTKKQIEAFWETTSALEYEAGYYPDVTDNKFQELVINIAKRQIDEGADAIWIDGLYNQATALAIATKNPNHIAVKDSFDGSSEIVNEIHKYAEQKGRDVYVGTWVSVAFLPFQPPKIDFLTFSPNKEEILNKEFNEERWNLVKSRVNEAFGQIPVFVYIDYSASDDSPMATFSQKLSSSEQKEFLVKIDEFCQTKGMTFAYPVHGFFMGQHATILSFGKSNLYDSLAPEFQTYETIKELAQSKK